MKIDSGLLRRGFAALAIGLLAASAGAAQPAAAGWQKHENLAPVNGADGKPHAAMCSGYPGTDPKFSFWTKKGTSKNLAVFFEGGGACWDKLTCSFPSSDPLPPGIPPQLQFFVPAIDANSTPANYDGIFNAENPANPVKDWTMVYVPYCTGDLHIGSAQKTYANGGNPYIPPTFDIQHRGFDNFMVVLDWMKKNVDKPKNVLVAGASAGGYGATANFPWIERTFRNAHTYVMADASQGVTTPTWDTYGRSSWNIQLAPWIFGDDPAAIAGPELMRVAAEALPHVKTAQYTTAYDATQISFYGLMKQFYPPGGSCPNPALDWHHQMVDTLQSYVADVPNFRYYLAEGTDHTLLRSAKFYTEDSAGVNFSVWLGDMLANRGGTGGHGGNWENAACESCLLQLPCPTAP